MGRKLEQGLADLLKGPLAEAAEQLINDGRNLARARVEAKLAETIFSDSVKEFNQARVDLLNRTLEEKKLFLCFHCRNVFDRKKAKRVLIFARICSAAEEVSLDTVCPGCYQRAFDSSGGQRFARRVRRVAKGEDIDDFEYNDAGIWSTIPRKAELHAMPKTIPLACAEEAYELGVPNEISGYLDDAVVYEGEVLDLS